MRTHEKTRSVILQELLEIAQKNGFEWNDDKTNWGALVIDFNFYSLIYRHDFAKAIWGEEKEYQEMLANYKKMEEQGMKVDYSTLPPPVWKRNLEGLLFAEDKFLYLEKHLENIQNGGKVSEEEVDKRRADLINRLGGMYKNNG